jgi:hypothetical protein
MSIPQELQEMIERGRQAAEEAHRAQLDSAGLPEWMHEHLSYDGYRTERYRLMLPGCAPIEFRVARQWLGFWQVVYSARVDEPRAVYFDDEAAEWRIHEVAAVLPPDADSLDEAIALAAELGESWHAMHAEAERRNAEGLRPETPPAKPRPQVPSIDELMVSALEKNDGSINALIIIAAELRAIRYALTPEQNDDRTAESEIAALTAERDGLREQLIEADAANAGLIRELRRLRSWTTDPTVAINEVSGDRI